MREPDSDSCAAGSILVDPATGDAGGGWHTVELRVALSLDLPVPEAFEFRRYALSLDLPRPLLRGESHEIAIRYRSRIDHPHYVSVPRYPCDLFVLSIKFGHRRPRSVYRIDKAFQSDVLDPQVCGGILIPDTTDEVRTQFSDLAPGFAYGVKWSAA